MRFIRVLAPVNSGAAFATGERINTGAAGHFNAIQFVSAPQFPAKMGSRSNEETPWDGGGQRLQKKGIGVAPKTAECKLHNWPAFNAPISRRNYPRRRHAYRHD